MMPSGPMQNTSVAALRKPRAPPRNSWGAHTLPAGGALSSRPSIQDANPFGLGSSQEVGASPSPQARAGAVGPTPRIKTAASTEAFSDIGLSRTQHILSNQHNQKLHPPTWQALNTALTHSSA